MKLFTSFVWKLMTWIIVNFFPKLTNMHIERGLKLMERDYKYAGNKEKFIKNHIKKIDE